MNNVIEGQAFSQSYDLAPRPLPPPVSVSKLERATHRKIEIERQLAHGKGGEEGGRGAESYDRKKAWSSVNHSILSGLWLVIYCNFTHWNLKKTPLVVILLSLCHMQTTCLAFACEDKLAAICNSLTSTGRHFC